MLNLFHKRKTEKEHPYLDKAASFFARNIIRTQTRIAAWLSTYEQRMTVPQKKIALILFCISLSIFAGSFFYRGLTGINTKSPSWLQEPSIVLPETHSLPDSTILEILRKKSATWDTATFQTGSIHR